MIFTKRPIISFVSIFVVALYLQGCLPPEPPATGLEPNILATEIVASENGRILDENQDSVFDQYYADSVSIRHFDGVLTEKGVIHFDINSLKGKKLLNLELDFEITGFTSSTENVIIWAFANDNKFVLGEERQAMQFIGNYKPKTLGLGRHQIELSSTVLKGLIDAGASYITLLIENSRSGTDTQIGTINTGSAAKLIATYTNANLYSPASTASITDIDGNKTYDLIEHNPTGLSVRNFDSVAEVSILHFEIDEQNEGMKDAQLLFRLSSTTSHTDEVRLVAFVSGSTIEVNDAIKEGVLLASFNPNHYTFGDQIILDLDTPALEELTHTSSQFSIRFEGTALANISVGAGSYYTIHLIYQ